jgi:hypothetical protein
VTDFGGIIWVIGAGGTFEAGVPVVSKNEKSADAHGSILLTAGGRFAVCAAGEKAL